MGDQRTRLLWIGYGLSMIGLCFAIHQQQFIVLAAIYSLAFLLYFILGKLSQHDYTYVPRFNLLLKAILVFAFPLASDDIYRFYWDGYSVLEGISPYQFKPIDWLPHAPPALQPVYSELNSQEYFSVYPPALQVLFAFVAALSFKSIYLFSVLWKSLLLLADFCTIRLLDRWLKDADRKNIFWYAWNPLILFEILGNGHPEGLMIYFLVYAFYTLRLGQSNRSAILFGLAAAIKLFPIMLVAYTAKFLGIKKSIRYIGAVVLVFGFSLLPLWPYQSHFYESIRLYFGRFEFNGSLFEIWRAIDFHRFGFDNVSHISPYLSFAFMAGCAILFINQKKHDLNALLKSYFIAWVIYLLLSTTVHPWYILPMLCLGLLRSQQWVLIWSWTVILSYAWYDESIPVKWKFGCIITEYLIVLIAVFSGAKKVNDRLFAS